MRQVRTAVSRLPPNCWTGRFEQRSPCSMPGPWRKASTVSLALLAAKQQRWYDAAMTLSAASELRRRTAIHRSPLITGLLSQVEADIGHRLLPGELAEAQREGRLTDVLRRAPQ